MEPPDSLISLTDSSNSILSKSPNLSNSSPRSRGGGGGGAIDFSSGPLPPVLVMYHPKRMPLSRSRRPKAMLTGWTSDQQTIFRDLILAHAVIRSATWADDFHRFLSCIAGAGTPPSYRYLNPLKYRLIHENRKGGPATMSSLLDVILARTRPNGQLCVLNSSRII